MRFWQYRKNGAEYWVDDEAFIKNIDYMKSWALANLDKQRQYTKKYVQKNPEKALEAWRKSAKKRYQTNKETWLLRNKKWRDENRDWLREYEAKKRAKNRDHIRQRHKKWRDANKESNLDRQREYHKKRRNEDDLFALTLSLRARTWNAFSKKGFAREKGFCKLLGCTFKEAKAHLESLFQPGMSWENRSEWHIDHIIPLGSAKTVEDLIALCHYTNLQPLWAKDNLRKGAKMPSDLQKF